MRKYIGVVTAVAFFIFVPAVFAAKAKAIINGTAENSPIAGEAVFTEVDGGLDVVVSVVNVPPGKHGFHIHENGSCADMGKAAGGHFNPDGVMHGLVSKGGFTHAHAGDFGNIEIAQDGTGTLKMLIPNLTLSGEKYNVLNKAVILHEKEDDFGQPTGNAGGRIGCGLIAPVAESVTQEEVMPEKPEVKEEMVK